MRDNSAGKDEPSDPKSVGKKQSLKKSSEAVQPLGAQTDLNVPLEKIEIKEPLPKDAGSTAKSLTDNAAHAVTKPAVPAPVEPKPAIQNDYDALKSDRSISPSELVKDKRFWLVARTLTSFVVGSISEKYGKDTTLTSSEKRTKRASRLRQALIDLGPTFIKLGQFLSVRRDILSSEMADELTLLQDRVPPFDVETVRKIIELDLGAPPEKVFVKFEDLPIASASIGQVHRAWLKDGTPVVVKVQRPNLASRFYQDLGYMRLAIKLGGAMKPSGEWEDWLKLSDEFGKTLFQEINYLQEGKNADRLRQILKNHPDIRVPRVFWKYTGKRVLTLEYIPGIKIDNIEALKDSGLDLVAIGNRLVSCYLDQVLLHGFFHADPHAGNIAIDDWGNVVLYDFGTIGEITEVQRDAITGCIASVIRRDLDELIIHLKVLGIVKENAKVEPVRRAIAPLIDYYAGKELRHLDFSNIESDIDQIVDDRAISLPPTLTYLLRTGTSIEGVARILHPNFSFVEAAKPSLRKWILNKPDQAAKVLKLMGSEYAGVIKAAWMRLVNSKTQDNSLSFLQAAPTANKQIAEKEDVKAQDAPHEKDDRAISDLVNELEQVKSRVKTLETEIKEVAQNRVNLLVQSVWLLAFSLLYVGTCLITELQPYANYFLIGNGVMVARIIGHLVRSSKLRGRTGTTDLSRRQRR